MWRALVSLSFVTAMACAGLACAGGKAADSDGGGDVADAPGTPDGPIVFQDAAPTIDAAPSPIDAAVPLPDAMPTPAVCGNGVVETGEECEDGNVIQTDGCRLCQWARCGDGVVRTGVEECDDGNTADGDACSAVCLTCAGGDARFTWTGNHHCYTRFEALVPWITARDNCAASRGFLVSFDTMAENDAVALNLLGGAANYWLGFTDQVTENSFLWANEEPVVFTNWSPGEPNDSGGVEDCTELYVNGVWNDADCGTTRGYVCEDTGWQIRPADNHAYRFVYHLVSWNGALSECAAMGGHLATITTGAESAFVNTHETGNMWIGATDAAAEGTFTWTTGEAFVFNNWSPGEPNDSGGMEDCAEVRPTGWNDENCLSLRGFVCEID